MSHSQMDYTPSSPVSHSPALSHYSSQFPQSQSIPFRFQQIMPSQIMPSQIMQGPSHSSPSVTRTPKFVNASSRSGIWSASERDAFLEWLSRDLRNQELLKTKQKQTCAKVALEVFGGTRTGDSIRNQWTSMKQKYSEAKAKLKSTGEGQRDDTEKWASIKLAWLNKLCPYFEAMDDILQRDRTHTPFYVSETGGDLTQPDSQGYSSDGHFQSDEDELYVDEESLHPPAGGQKLPLKKGEKTGEGKSGLKRKRPTSAEEAVERLHQERVGMERERLKQEMERDDKRLKQEREISERTFQLAETRERNRHEEMLARLSMMEKKYELDMMVLRDRNKGL